MEQRDHRMPATGEAWRHYKGGLYTVIGMAVDDEGNATVVYTKYNWGLIQLPPLFTQTLGLFLQQVEHDKPRFQFERECGTDNECPFIHPITGTGFRAFDDAAKRTASDPA